MGSTSHPADDPVCFAPHPGMGFPVSELKAVEYDEEDEHKPPVIRVYQLKERKTFTREINKIKISMDFMKFVTKTHPW